MSAFCDIETILSVLWAKLAWFVELAPVPEMVTLVPALGQQGNEDAEKFAEFAIKTLELISPVVIFASPLLPDTLLPPVSALTPTLLVTCELLLCWTTVSEDISEATSLLDPEPFSVIVISRALTVFANKDATKEVIVKKTRNILPFFIMPLCWA